MLSTKKPSSFLVLVSWYIVGLTLCFCLWIENFSLEFLEDFLDILSFISSSVSKLFWYFPHIISRHFWGLYSFQTSSILSSPFEISKALMISPYSVCTRSYYILERTIMFLPTTFLMKVHNFLHSLTDCSYFCFSAINFLRFFLFLFWRHVSTSIIISIFSFGSL